MTRGKIVLKWKQDATYLTKIEAWPWGGSVATWKSAVSRAKRFASTTAAKQYVRAKGIVWCSRRMGGSSSDGWSSADIAFVRLVPAKKVRVA